MSVNNCDCCYCRRDREVSTLIVPPTDFNMNDQATVQLTDYGRSVHRLWYVILFDSVDVDFGFEEKYSAYEKEIKDGFLTTELWRIMQMFGTKHYMGNKNCFVDNKISIKKGI
jgi:hypothetical protein